MMSELLEKWLTLFTFNQDTIHNVVLAIVYIRLISIPFQSIYFRNRAEEASDGVMTEWDGNKRKDSKFIGILMGKKMVVGLITNFLLGSLLLAFVQPSILESWLFSEWTSENIVLISILGSIVLSILVAIIVWIKVRNKSFIQVLAMLIYLLVIEFIFFSIVLWLASNIFSTASYYIDSPVYVSEIDGKSVAISQTGKDLETSPSQGVKRRSKSAVISSVDLPSGKKLWSKKVGSETNYIGPTSNGLLIINGNKATLYFLDPATGDVSMTEEDLIKKFPEAANNFSYDKADFVLTNPNTLYFYGLDGLYYKIDFAANEMTKNAAYRNFIDGTNESTTAEGNSKAEKFNQFYPEFMNAILNNADVGEDRALVTYTAARNDAHDTLALVSLTEHRVFWEFELTNDFYAFGEADENYVSTASYAKDAFVYAWDGRYLYKINKENGKVKYQYDYRTAKKNKQ